MNDFERYKDKTEPLTDVEFESLERYENGRIIAMSAVWYLFTDEQVSRLHSDDWSYHEELLEESRIEMAEALGFFGRKGD